MSERNCPFYGRSMQTALAVKPALFVLFDSRGNQCALVTDAHSPCLLEIEGRPVEWRECPRVEAIRP